MRQQAASALRAWSAAARKAAKKLYKKFLTKGNASVRYDYGGTGSIKLVSYLLLDINQDGVSELLVKNTEATKGVAMGAYYVFAVNKGKVVYCGSVVMRGTANAYYNKKHKALMNSGWTNFVGGAWAHLFRLKSNTIQQYKYMWEGYADRGSSQYVYYIGSSDKSTSAVSKGKFDKFAKKYFNQQDIKEYKFKTNSAANRKKSFG